MNHKWVIGITLLTSVCLTHGLQNNDEEKPLGIHSNLDLLKDENYQNLSIWKDPPAKRRFPVIWNDLTDICLFRENVDAELRSYSVIENSFYGWRGEQISLVGLIGLVPYVEQRHNNTLINGGIPQAVDIKAHLNKAAKDLPNFIPDPKYRGLAVFDWEKWRPLYRLNWDSNAIYQKLSRDRVKKKHPTWTPKQIEAEASSEFNAAARTIFEGTLNLAKQLRPFARWGFYGWPRCYYYPKTTCNAGSIQAMNDLSWWWKASTALFPRIYTNPNQGHGSWLHSRNEVVEAVRLREYTGNKDLKIYPYTNIGENKFFQTEDLKNTMLVSAQFGADGVVVWGDAKYLHNTTRCLKWKKYVHDVLGPFLQKYL